MLAIEASLLGARLERPGQALLDAGCGAGGFLLWARGLGAFDRLAGVDVSPEAIDAARATVPEADLHVAALDSLPFEDGSFDVVVLNDVLQHVHEDAMAESLAELRRVTRADGALLVRTNGGRRGFRAREDWRKYDRGTLEAELGRGGFRVERVTAANTALSLLAAVRGRTPQAPSSASHGIPADDGGLRGRVGERLLRVEARWLRSPKRSLPYGHTLFALARPA